MCDAETFTGNSEPPSAPTAAYVLPSSASEPGPALPAV